MKILAFDTSSKATSVAIVEDGQLLGEVTLNTVVNHSVTLMPTIDYLMAQVALKPKDIDRIAVSQGPGSYTGIRIAVTCAKTLAYSLNCELVGISSLQAIAARQKSEKIVISLLNARRGMVYLAAYQKGKNLIPDQYLDFSDFLKEWKSDEQLVFTGETELFRDQILAQFPEARVVTDSFETLPSAYEIAKIADKMAPVANIHDFNPIYLKKVEAEEKWEAANGTTSDDKELVSRA